jgi:hypothetical protein
MAVTVSLTLRTPESESIKKLQEEGLIYLDVDPKKGYDQSVWLFGAFVRG